ncbi:hypothetical protein KL944_002968 [Ogataea haglerorum]|nr:hypothetical protein KL944_002968 [Ogataea haglerorum]
MQGVLLAVQLSEHFRRQSVAGFHMRQRHVHYSDGTICGSRSRNLPHDTLEPNANFCAPEYLWFSKATSCRLIFFRYDHQRKFIETAFGTNFGCLGGLLFQDDVAIAAILQVSVL